MKRKVEQLYLSVGPKTSFKFPLCFFTCDSLTVLELDTVILNVPNTVSFPRVKILRLTNMDLGNGIWANKLLSNCPILEELSLIRCSCFKSEVLCIANLALKILHIFCCYFQESTLRICAPNLCTIRYGGEFPLDFVFDSFPSLVEADINIVNCSSANTFLLVKLFEKLSNVKLLRISDGFKCLSAVQVLGEADILLYGSLTFNNLNHLELRSACVSTARRLFRFIQLSPNLESIVFPWSFLVSDKEDDEYLSLNPPPHLKSIKILNFMGLPSELNIIKLFIKYARFLETITIVASPKLSTDHEQQINAMQMLLMLPKPICALKILCIGYCYFTESTLRICAPNLCTIRYAGQLPVDFVFGSFPSLGEADILLSGSLTFNNLIHLEVRPGRVSTVRRYFRFIQLSPNLESIVFPESILVSDKEDDEYLSLDPPPHLKSIKILNFEGLPSELNAIKLFIKYARFLETITIVASSRLSKDHEKQINAMQALLMFPKPANCVVKFLKSSGNA